MIDRPGIRVLLLDVEGTTTSKSFVYDVLFPFARAHLREFLQTAAKDHALRDDLAVLVAERRAEREAGAPEWRGGGTDETLAFAAGYAEWLMDRDRKSTALKSLQGQIWKSGYRSGGLKSHVYPDVRPALERCRAQRRSVAIFSSGSVLAQRLLFEHTVEGDLTPLIHAYFDTTTGPKQAAHSYRRIAEALRVAPAAVLFVSDVPAELDAAREAGMGTGLCVRADGAPPASDHPVLRTFDEA
ncbi:MAG TPA: acireductone synthase [Vicinamibacteria bacterium]|nr:acireductone synthase [Vicinamibacteria bacterium]